MNIILMQAGEVLKYLIKKSPLNQEQVAKELNMSQSKVSRLLNSEVIPQEDILKICGIIQIDAEQFQLASEELAKHQNIEDDLFTKYIELQEKYIESMERLARVQEDNMDLLNEINSLKSRLAQYESGNAKVG